MTEIIIYALVISLGLLSAYKQYTNNKQNAKPIKLSSNCPSCNHELNHDSLLCINCGLDMNSNNEETISDQITCPVCTNTFHESLTNCPSCGEYKKLVHRSY